ncbi:histone-lysine N-methyltransferase SETD1A-like [Salarias fasciatus]|uniref:histone-lysine N-methyltransferase SETD1A-like n=1 Tax=Salarias fasciatus TaxID=181472 RepID=UPI0011768C7E|nr:histone-lysine N-methyltransferase SETD1A-like [Salarias fasciatus]XP_029968942.1 histone-lysine N-methyltransferase SETD1A-like [Salarias fasciatus]
MGDVDPEDAKSLDSSDGAALAAEENHSSNSDMVHLEREEAEMLEEAESRGRTGEEEEEEDEMQTSVLSVLGGERELVALREEEQDLHAPETEELLVSAEEPRREREPVEFRHVVPPMALPPLPIVKLHPPSTTSTPVPSTTTSEAEEPYPSQGLLPPAILSAMAAEPPAASPEQLRFSQVPLSDEHSEKESQAAAEKPEPPPPPPAPETKPLTSTELLCGGAALVAVVGVVAYGAVVYCRK